MSDKTGAPKPLGGGSGAILRGLAVGALLSGPVVAPATAAGAEPPAVEASTVVDAVPVDEIAPGDGDTCPKPTASAALVAAIREQFKASFTPGAVGPAESAPTDIICLVA